MNKPFQYAARRGLLAIAAPALAREAAAVMQKGKSPR